MGGKLNKSLILNRIKSHYNFKKEIELATFLGIASNTLGNWYSRNTMNFDRIFTKCEKLNPNWIINGQGRPTKDYDNLKETEVSTVTEDLSDHYGTAVIVEEVDRLAKIVSLQERTITAQAKTIAVMEKLIDKNAPVQAKE